MILDLKQVFLVENAKISVTAEVPMSKDDQGSACFTEPVTAAIMVENHAGFVEFTADVRLTCQFDCDRCAITQSRTFNFKFRHVLVTSLSDESGDDYVEAPDYKLDTAPLLRDDILLEFPSKLLCKESCKGLCPRCGKNLNEGSCACEQQETDPRLAVLKQLLSDT